MLDAASGDAIISKTLREIRELISVMAVNSQQFNVKTESTTRHVNEVTTKPSNLRHDDITSLLHQTVTVVNKLVVSQEICAVQGYPTDLSLSLQDDNSWV